MDCEICANGNKLSPSLQRGERQRERPYNVITESTHIISQSVGVRIQRQGQLNQGLHRDSLL